MSAARLDPAEPLAHQRVTQEILSHHGSARPVLVIVREACPREGGERTIPYCGLPDARFRGHDGLREV